MTKCYVLFNQGDHVVDFLGVFSALERAKASIQGCEWHGLEGTVKVFGDWRDQHYFIEEAELDTYAS